jgi:nucleotide-binding universal stress UspA family protein
MTQTMKIMAAVDLSDYSKTIIRYSGWLAKRLAAELLLVNVVNQRDIDMVGPWPVMSRSLFRITSPSRSRTAKHG